MHQEKLPLLCLEKGILEECLAKPDEAFIEYDKCRACVHCLGAEIGRLTVEVEDWKEKALCDPLTCLPNLRALQEKFDGLTKTETGQGRPFGAIGYDLENFAHTNFLYSQGGGDAGIRVFASILNEVIRDDDAFAARKGGDEFIVLLDLGDRENLSKFGHEPTKLKPADRLKAAADRHKQYFESQPIVEEYNKRVAPSKEWGLRAKPALHEPGMSLVELVNASDPKGMLQATNLFGNAMPNRYASFDVDGDMAIPSADQAAHDFMQYLQTREPVKVQ